MNLSLILHALDYSAGAKPAARPGTRAGEVARRRSPCGKPALMTSNRASTLESNHYSMAPSRASQTNRIGGLASW